MDHPRYRNRAFCGAYWAGRSAAIAGQSRDCNPYDDPRTLGGKVTWACGFRSAWLDGYESGIMSTGRLPLVAR